MPAMRNLHRELPGKLRDGYISQNGDRTFSGRADRGDPAQPDDLDLRILLHVHDALSAIHQNHRSALCLETHRHRRRALSRAIPGVPVVEKLRSHRQPVRSQSRDALAPSLLPEAKSPGSFADAASWDSDAAKRENFAVPKKDQG